MSDWTEDMMQEIEDDEEQIRLLTEANARLVGFAQELQARLEAYMGGGRESGSGLHTGPEQSEGVLTSSAANPAACPFCKLVHHQGYFPKRTQVHAHGERIRALEAELADLKERELPAWLRMEKAWYAERDALKARVAELETLLIAQEFHIPFEETPR